MAKTWRTGEFGLTSFDDHNLEFNELIQHFNDNINENFDDTLNLYKSTNVKSTADIQIALDVSTTDMDKNNTGYTDIALSGSNIYTDIAKYVTPVSGYEDRIKNT